MRKPKKISQFNMSSRPYQTMWFREEFPMWNQYIREIEVIGNTCFLENYLILKFE